MFYVAYIDSRMVQDINLLLSPKEPRELRRKSQNISINRSFSAAITLLYFAHSAFLCIVPRVPIVEVLIKSRSLVLFLSLYIFYADAARIRDVSTPPFPSPFIYCFRPSPSCLSLYDFSRSVRPIWHKIFLSAVTHRAGKNIPLLSRYFSFFFSSSCPRLTARHRTVADAVCLSRFPLDAFVCGEKASLARLYSPFPLLLPERVSCRSDYSAANLFAVTTPSG